MRSDGHAVFHAQAVDQFGDQGIIAFALVEKGKDRWHVKSLLMSCRVLGRGIEEAFVAEIAARAAASGAQSISVTCEPSEKNEPARVFVQRRFGSAKEVSTADITRPHWITMIY